MSFKTLFLGLSAIFLSGPQASADGRSELAQLARPFVKQTTRELHVYHWAAQDRVFGQVVGPMDSRDPRALGYASYLKELFWNPGNAGGAVGPGFYVAIDPVASKQYGGANWFLLQVVMPARTRYLDLGAFETASANRLPPSLLTYLKAKSCETRFFSEIFMNTPQAGCRAVRDQLVRDLDLMALRYLFMATQMKSLCESRSNEAFVLFDDRAMGWDRMIVLTADIPADDPHLENRVLINALFAAADQPEVMIGGVDYPWPSLASVKPRIDVRAWARSTLFGCGGHAEDL